MGKLNLNLNPYFDDYDPSKNYVKVLFKPGVPVQARELTQLQTALQAQIDRFGSHVFKNGSMVRTCNPILAKSGFVIVHKIVGFDFDNIMRRGAQLVGLSTGVKAIVRHCVESDVVNEYRLYVEYTANGTGGEKVFAQNETISLVNNTLSRCQVVNRTEYYGIGSLFTMEEGDFFVDGFFVQFNGAIIELSNDETPSCHVVLDVVHRIVDVNEDNTLYDNAIGSNNFAAPGADRYQVQLVPKVLALNDATATGKDRILMLTVEDGNVLFLNDKPRYSEIEKIASQRLYDSSGNFTVTGLKVETVEDKKSSFEITGRSLDGDENMFCYKVAPGYGYVMGNRVDVASSTFLRVPKARDASHTIVKKDVTVRPEFGQYLYVTTFLGGLPDFDQHEKIDIYNATTGGTKIGELYAFDIDYYRGDLASNTAIFKLSVRDITFTNPATTSMLDIGRLEFTGGSCHVVHEVEYTIEEGAGFVNNENVTDLIFGDMALVHLSYPVESRIYLKKNSALVRVPRVGAKIKGDTSNAVARITKVDTFKFGLNNALIFEIPEKFPIRLRNESNVISNRYYVKRRATFTTNSSGDGSFTITDGYIESLETGTFVAVSPSGAVDVALFSLNSTGTVVSISGYSPNTTIECSFEVLRTNVAERTKTLTTRTQTGLTVSSTGEVQLDRADIFAIDSITSSIISGDVKSLFVLDNGQRDTHYQNGRLRTSVNPTSLGTLTVNYRYWHHSASGDYFSIDSYQSYGGDYVQAITDYVSTNNGKRYSLRKCLDFRKILTDSASLPVSGKALRFDMQCLMPRIDYVVLRQNSLDVISGTPNETPTPPALPKDAMPLCRALVEPYTFHATRDVRLIDVRVPRYWKIDIQQIERRIGRLEDYSMAALSVSELSESDRTLRDAETGLVANASDYVIENFSGNEFVQIDNDLFSVEFRRQMCIPKQTMHSVQTGNYNLSNSVNNNDEIVVLPYSVVEYKSQLLSSRVVNVNAYWYAKVISELKIDPKRDNWVDEEYLPDIYREHTTVIPVTRVETVPVVREETITLTNYQFVTPPPQIPQV